MKTLHNARIEAKQIVNKWTLCNGIIGWLPGSTLMLSGTDWTMIRSVAKAFDVQLTENNLLEIKSILSAIVIGKGVNELLLFLPGVGWAVKAISASVATKAIGEFIFYYCEKRSLLP